MRVLPVAFWKGIFLLCSIVIYPKYIDSRFNNTTKQDLFPNDAGVKSGHLVKNFTVFKGFYKFE